MIALVGTHSMVVETAIYARRSVLGHATDDDDDDVIGHGTIRLSIDDLPTGLRR